jgi:hypothetical protein
VLQSALSQPASQLVCWALLEGLGCKQMIKTVETYVMSSLCPNQAMQNNLDGQYAEAL